jgi:molybdenum cofactor cytidylyltransferase
MSFPSPGRLFVVVPAAGASRRMGQPKLLLPWKNGTVISTMLAHLRHPAIAAVFVVVRPGDAALSQVVGQCGGTVVTPVAPPPEMRQSVECALREIADHWSPTSADGWMLIPADHPLLDAAVLDPLVSAWKQNPSRILIPVFQGKRGHPTLFPWSITADVFQLPPDQGLNQLVKARPDLVQEVEVNSSGVLTDLDTPEDYRRLAGEIENRQTLDGLLSPRAGC